MVTSSNFVVKFTRYYLRVLSSVYYKLVQIVQSAKKTTINPAFTPGLLAMPGAGAGFIVHMNEAHTYLCI